MSARNEIANDESCLRIPFEPLLNSMTELGDVGSHRKARQSCRYIWAELLRPGA